MKRVKRTNAVIVHPNQWVVFAPCNPYAMNMDSVTTQALNTGQKKNFV